VPGKKERRKKRTGLDGLTVHKVGTCHLSYQKEKNLVPAGEAYFLRKKGKRSKKRGYGGKEVIRCPRYTEVGRWAPS